MSHEPLADRALELLAQRPITPARACNLVSSSDIERSDCGLYKFYHFPDSSVLAVTLATNEAWRLR